LGLVGASWSLQRVLQQVVQVAPRPTTVLVLGEPGVGKELVAQAIHTISGRAGDLLAVNCGAMSDQLLQSELFGHVRGAFSGAGKARQGLVAAAHGGTLFLDEIGDASPALQVSLLRLLENGEYRPVGSDRVEHAQVRVLAATNQLEPGLASGELRADLQGRLSQWVIQVPPLRYRREDIPSLAAHFAAVHRGGPVQLDHRLALALCLHDWPGNVRELGSFMERTVVECGGAERLRPSPEQLRRLGLGRRPATLSSRPTSTASTSPGPRAARPDAAELEAGLHACGGSMKELATHLGVGRNTLYRWFAAAGLDPKKVRSSGSQG
jgi:DNA-binding NtrC family response regulator